MQGLDFEDIWMIRDGMYPILKIAKDYAPAEYGKADMSWFDSTAKTDTYAIADYKDLLGLSRICAAGGSVVDTFVGNYNFQINRVLTDYITTDLFTSSVANKLSGNLNGTLDTANVVALYAQSSTTVTNNKYNVRIIAEIKGSDWTAAGFDFMVSYKDANGNVVASNIAQVTDIDTCYTSLLATSADSTTAVTAAEGHYFVVFVLEGISTANGEVTIGAVANVSNNDGTVCGNAGSFTFDANGKPVA